jgi:hypothetical protein
MQDIPILFGLKYFRLKFYIFLRLQLKSMDDNKIILDFDSSAFLKFNSYFNVLPGIEVISSQGQILIK